MAHVATDRFTVAVFQDVQWAERGIQALRQHGFAPEDLSLIARDTPETVALARSLFGTDPGRLELPGLGSIVAHGPLVPALQGDDRGLEARGLAATLRRAGFQAHDGFIFDTLTSRGGVLTAIRTEPRAADALAVLHAYGGGNAAIGAWSGRV